MSRFRSQLSYSNVISTICLFLVLAGGTAYALDGSNTVFSDDLVNGEVKEADIGQGAVTNDEIENGTIVSADIRNGEVNVADLANGAVNSAKLADGQVMGVDVANDNLTGADIGPNSLKGADVDEGSLAGALIPGIASSGLVKSSGLVRVDDPVVPSTPTVETLLTSGPFTVSGVCENEGPTSDLIEAEVLINSSVDGWAVHSNAENGAFGAFALTTGHDARLIFVDEVNAAGVRAGDYAAAAANKLLSGEVFAAVNTLGADCVFGVTGIG